MHDCSGFTGTQLANLLTGVSSPNQTEGATFLTTLGLSDWNDLQNFQNVATPANSSANALLSQLRAQLWQNTAPDNSTTYQDVAQVYAVLRSDPGHNKTHAVLNSPWGFTAYLNPDLSIGHASRTFSVRYDNLAAVCLTVGERPNL